MFTSNWQLTLGQIELVSEMRRRVIWHHGARNEGRAMWLIDPIQVGLLLMGQVPMVMRGVWPTWSHYCALNRVLTSNGLFLFTAKLVQAQPIQLSGLIVIPIQNLWRTIRWICVQHVKWAIHEPIQSLSGPTIKTKCTSPWPWKAQFHCSVG